MTRTFLAALATIALAAMLGPATALAQSDAVNVSEATGASTNPGAATDAADRVHLVWADNPGSEDSSTQYLYYARSTDGGATFEAPRRLPTDADAGRRPREIRVVTTGADVVAVSWWDAVVLEDGRVFVTAFFARSGDGGDTFAPAIETSLRYRDDAAAKEGFRNTTSLSLAAGPDGSFGLLATIPDVFRGFNIYYARSVDGTTFLDSVKVTSYALAIPRAAANGLTVFPNGTIYATWSESVGDFVNEIRDVLAATSTDGGRSFSSPTKIAHVRGVVGAVLRTGNAVALLTQSQQNDNKLSVTKFFRSTNGGKTYGPKARVARPPGYNHLHQNSVAANASGIVAVAWTENSSTLGGVDGLYVAVSRDGGKHFDPAALVVAGLFIDPPSITVDGQGRVGLAFSSSDPSLADREVLFVRVGV